MQFYPIIWDGGKLNKELFIQSQANETLVIVQYQVRQREIKSLDLTRLRLMADSISEIGAPARECLLLLYDGYDHDPRELSEIPEVVEYMKRTVEVFPHIWYFLHSDVNQHVFTAIVPHAVYPNPFPALPIAKRVVELDIAAAHKQFSALSAALREYGDKIGDPQGARDSIRQWRQTLNL